MKKQQQKTLTVGYKYTEQKWKRYMWIVCNVSIKRNKNVNQQMMYIQVKWNHILNTHLVLFQPPEIGVEDSDLKSYCLNQ